MTARTLLHLLPLLSITWMGAVGQQSVRTPISQDPDKLSANPRLVRTGLGADRNQIIAGVAPGVVYESMDDGVSFNKVARNSCRFDAVLQYCAVLCEVPRSVGSIEAGSLLYSADFCDHGMMSTDVYSSQDRGRT